MSITRNVALYVVKKTHDMRPEEESIFSKQLDPAGTVFAPQDAPLLSFNFSTKCAKSSQFQKLKKWIQKKVKLSNAFNIAIKAALTEIKGGNDEVTLQKSCNILYRYNYKVRYRRYKNSLKKKFK